MASAAVQVEEEALIREIVAHAELPKGVRFKAIQPITDSTGDPAWRITFSVSRSIPLTKRRLTELREMQMAISARVFELKLGRFPYFHLTESK